MSIASYAPLIGGLATIVAALVTVVGGSFAYRRQRDIDQKNFIRQERRRVYQQFMLSMIPATRGQGDEHLAARLEVGVLGSDKVIRALGVYNAYCDATNPGSNMPRDIAQYKLLLSDVLQAMREDVFDKTQIDRKEYGDLLPIN